MTQRLTFTVVGFEPDWASHPGETLRELLIERGWPQAELARLTGLSKKHVNRVIRGHTGIGPDMALRLEAVTHVSAEFWAARQAHYDVAVARRTQKGPGEPC